MLRFFPVILFSCCTFLCVAIFSSCTFSRVASCCTYFSLNFFRVVLIWSYSFSKLHFLHVFFILHLFFELHSFLIAPFFARHSFDIVLHLFSWCTVVLFSCFIFFVLLHIAPCCILLQCCSSFKLHCFHVLFFSYYSVFIMSFFHGPLFMSHHFSCCNVSMLYLMCTLFMLHLRVALFSCRSLDLHFWPVLFYSFHGVPFRCCFSSHWACCTIQSSMSLSFHVVPFFSSTFFIWYFFIIHSPMAILHALVISCCCLLRLQFFILRFFHVALFYLYAFFSCYIFSGCTIFLL